MAPSPPVRQVSSQVPLHHVEGRSCRPPGDIARLRQQFDDLPIRPADKDSNWSVPYDQLFDQYVDADLLDLSSDNTGEGTSSDDLANFFDISSFSNGSAPAKTSPMPNWDPSRHTEPEDAWQQAWGYIGSNVAPAAPEGNQTSILPDSAGKAVASAPELFSLAAPPSCSPQVPSEPFVFSAPPSPRPIVSSSEPRKFNSLPIRGSKRQTPSVIRRSVSKVGFVNYTPDDSRKILTGVAPSGSSKTKARREKEAAEKRRRLSQAAARAIIEAGGDLAALEREGLLCLPEAKEMLAARGHVA
ncbi:hypothetical protein SLS57_004214 [Botryosphaeria dothidea]